MLTFAIKILTWDTAHPLICEDAGAWGEVFSFQDTFVGRIFCVNVASDGTPFHASNVASRTMWNLTAFGSSKKALSTFNLEVFENEDEMLKTKMIKLVVEFHQDFLLGGQVLVVVICKVGKSRCHFVNTVEGMKERHSGHRIDG